MCGLGLAALLSAALLASAQQEQKPPRRIRVSSRVMEANRIHYVQPDYHRIAKLARFEGAVKLEAVQQWRHDLSEVPIRRELRGGEVHSYRIRLTEGQYVYVVVEQRGVDVVVAVFDVRGKQLAEFDSPTGTEGPEPVELVTEVSQTYRLEVRGFQEESRGRYEIRVEELQEATTEDRNRIAPKAKEGWGYTALRTFWILAGVFMVFFGAQGVRSGVIDIWRRYRSDRWATADGVVISIEWIDEQRSDDEPGASADVIYEYSVHGLRYESKDRLVWHTVRRTSLLTLTYQGAKIPVYYYTDSPHVSVLRPGLEWNDFIDALVGLALIACGVLWLTYGLGSERPPIPRVY